MPAQIPSADPLAPHVAVQRLLRQRLRQDRTRRQEAIEIDAGREAHGFEQKDEVFGHDIAGGAGRIGTTTDAALRRIEGGDAGIERRHHIGEPLPARIVQVRAAALGAERLAQAREQAPDLRRIGIADGVGQIDGVHAAFRHGDRHAHGVVLRHWSLDGAAERRRQPGIHLDGRIALVPQRHDGAHVRDDLGVGLANVAERMRLAHGNRNGDDMGGGLER